MDGKLESQFMRMESIIPTALGLHDSVPVGEHLIFGKSIFLHAFLSCRESILSSFDRSENSTVGQ
jgi:hypothetical protein